MRMLRAALILTLSAGAVGLVLVADSTKTVGTQMAEAANAFLTTLDAEQKSKAAYPAGSDERINWNFVPMQDGNRQPTRKGLGLFEMNDSQRQAVTRLLKAGTSETGYTQATTIMTLEGILNELEKGRGNVRDPKWYFVSVFGEPSKTGKWGWRVEGHHLSLNFLIENGEVVSTTPMFYGANPAEIRTGDLKGQRVLAKVEDTAFALIASLDDERKQKASRQEHFEEVSQTPEATVGEPEGLAAGAMTQEQREKLMAILKAYTDRMPPAVAEAEMTRVTEAGIDKVYFAYSGTGEKGKPYTYRVQGPTFVIEFLNIQADSQGNVANHIHSAWRRLPIDFGL